MPTKYRMAKAHITKMKWNSRPFEKMVRAEQVKALTRAAIFLAREMKENLSVGVGYAQNENGGRSVETRSNAGEFPRLEHGELRRSITYEVDSTNLTARIGTNKIYGKYLELGTVDMEARPFLRPTLAANRRKVVKILTTSIK